jgi:dephospho-CoA kinase
MTASDTLKKKLLEQGIEVTRENLGKLGNELRAKHGHHVVGMLIEEEIKDKNNDFVIEGMRHPEVIEYLKKTFPHNFTVIAVEAPIEKRFELSKKRGKKDDPQSLDQFRIADQIELGKIAAPNSQRMNECLRLAQYTIENNSSFEELEEKVEKLFQQIM